MIYICSTIQWQINICIGIIFKYLPKAIKREPKSDWTLGIWLEIKACIKMVCFQRYAMMMLIKVIKIKAGTSTLM